MNVFIQFCQFDLDVTPSSRNNMIQEYIQKMGGPDDVFNYFINHLHFVKDDSQIAEILDEERIDNK